MTVITLSNEKGGVAKTTLAVNLASGLAARGHRVMLVDGDPQGHATLRSGIGKYPGLYDLCIRDASWDSAVRQVVPEKYEDAYTTGGELYVLGSNIETRSIQSLLEDVTILAERIDELRDDNAIDIFIIDTSPTPSLLHAMFYMASDALIYPTKLAYTSFDGLIESVMHRMEANKNRDKRYSLPPIEVLGIVPTMYRKGTIADDSNLEKLQAKFGKSVWSPIHQRTVWQQAEDHQMPVYAIDPNSPAAGDVWEMVDRVEKYMKIRA
jgi:chromosome partitioning protein